MILKNECKLFNLLEEILQVEIEITLTIILRQNNLSKFHLFDLSLNKDKESHMYLTYLEIDQNKTSLIVLLIKLNKEIFHN